MEAPPDAIKFLIQFHFRIKVLFLKSDLFRDFFFGEPDSFRRGHKLVFGIVAPVNDSDDAGRVFPDRRADSKQIYVKVLPVAARHIRYRSVIDRVDEIREPGMDAAGRPVYFYRDAFPEKGFYKRFSECADNKSMLSLQVRFSAVVIRKLPGKGYLQVFIFFRGGRRAVEIIPEIDVIYPIGAAGQNNMDKMSL